MTELYSRMSQRKNSDDSDSEDRDNFIIDDKMTCEKNTNIRKRHFPLFIIIGVIIAFLIVGVIVAVGVVVVVVVRDGTDNNDNLPSDPARRAEALLQLYPVIDG